MWVKICANTNLSDAALAAELGADAVGFVFAPSKRQVTAEQVAPLIRDLPGAIEKIGVFTSESAEEILNAVSIAGLTAVQLHSSYRPQLITAIKSGSEGSLKVLQVVDVTADADEEVLRAALLEPLQNKEVTAVLLDASHGGTSGGTGKPFDWDRTAGIVREVQIETGGRVIIAGGLNAENVARAIKIFQPFGVDVASGVEEAPGRKSPDKLRAFIHAAKNPR